MEEAYLGIDVGSISTKGVIIGRDNDILAGEYIWTQGDPIGAVKELLRRLEGQFDKGRYQIVATGTTGSARKLVGAIVGATMVKKPPFRRRRGCSWRSPRPRRSPPG